MLDLLDHLRLAVQLLVQRLQARLELGTSLCQLRLVLQSKLLIGARLLIHLPGEAGVLLLLPRQQLGHLLVTLQLLAAVAQLGTQLLDLLLQLAQRSAGVGGGDEGAGPEGAAGLAERLVIPDGQGAGDLEPVQRLAVLGAEFVGGLVAFDAQGVEQVADVAVELDLAAQTVQQVCLAEGGVELDAGAHCQILCQRLAELAQLDQRGVGIAGEYPLGCAGELEEHRVVLLEEGEVTALGHVQSLEPSPGHSGLAVLWGGMMPDRKRPRVLN
ncbi:hypothetical protein D3C78_481280 [compost metagenome]